VDTPKKTNEEEKNQSIDRRVFPIAMSTFIVGSAIGVALPVMPLFAAELGLSTAEFGLVGSTFGAARLFSNPPLAMLSERVGRRQFLMWGPAITAVSMVGTGLSGSLAVLLGWRALAGLSTPHLTRINTGGSLIFFFLCICVCVHNLPS
jgi:MFS transporter, DHA1 family, multidrug resistance protein